MSKNDVKEDSYGIEVLHWPILVYMLFVVVVVVIVIDPTPPPIHQIELLRVLRSRTHPLHSWAALGSLADTEAIYFWDVDLAGSTLLTAVGVGIDEWRLVGRRACR